MSRRVSAPEAPAEPGAQPSSRPHWVVPAGQAAAILVLFAGAGALGGWVWWKLWSPAPVGIAYEGSWILVGENATAEFSATGWYVVIGLGAGLVLGALAGLLLDRKELVTLAAVVVGSVLAAWLMHRLGQSLGPPDPDPLARAATDGTEIPGQLSLAGTTPGLAFPIGAMGGLAAVLFGFTKRGRTLSKPGLCGNHRG